VGIKLTVGRAPRFPPTNLSLLPPPTKSVEVAIGVNRFCVPFRLSPTKCHDITIHHNVIIIITIIADVHIVERGRPEIGRCFNVTYVYGETKDFEV